MRVMELLSAQPWVERLGWTLIHFLWQGALIAALYAIARRSRSAQRRYLLGCVALVAMVAAPLVTFSIGGEPESGRPMMTAASPAPRAHVEPISPVLPVYIYETWHEDVMPWLVIAWFAGAVVFWARLTGSWIIAARMRSLFVRPAPAEWQHKLDDLRTRIRISQPVRLLTSALVQVPTVVGWLRPVILMPTGALAGLPIEHIEALLAHELAHIRRHDYLVNILQSAAEALLFYHPSVWWISTQIRNERELCCDDVAVATSGDALTYARALADLESWRPAHLALAANGGSLPDRIAYLLGQSRNQSRTMPGPGILVATALLAITAYSLFAQQPQPPRPSFEAVSIKPNNLGSGNLGIHATPGRLKANMTTKALIAEAFGVKDLQVSGGPPWLDQDNYDIIAKTPTPVGLSRKVLQPYLQSLLSDRYHFKFHTASKDFPGYALLPVKNGPKLTPHTGEEGSHMNSHGDSRKIDLTGVDVSMEGLADYLGQQLNQAVLDKTSLKGAFDFKLEWAKDDTGEASAPLIFTALQEQLGLRLEARKVPMEVIVVDSVDKPSEN